MGGSLFGYMFIVELVVIFAIIKENRNILIAYMFLAIIAILGLFILFEMRYGVFAISVVAITIIYGYFLFVRQMLEQNNYRDIEVNNAL